jgi:rhodanese-related sulfurtransferase
MTRTKSNIIIQALIIVALASALGFSVNGLRAEGIPFFQKGQGPTVPGISKIDLAQAKKYFDEGSALIIDSRSPEEFDEGHIKGAVNLPYEEFDELFDKILAEADNEKSIVVYCSGEDCHSSDILADRILEEGFTNIHVFFGGWPAWVAAKYPTSEIKPRQLYKLD